MLNSETNGSLAMLSTALLARSSNQISQISLAQGQTARLVRAIQPAPHIQFSGGAQVETRNEAGDGPALAHAAGVNCINVDGFEGRYLISGGADGEVSLWDLEDGAIPDSRTHADGTNYIGYETTNMGSGTESRKIRHTPSAVAPKSSKTHTHGLTSIHFYPFDSLAFTTSSYDHTLKLWDSLTLQASAAFTPGTPSSPVYTHATSPISPHLLVACGTQHPSVRLIDLRSGDSTHTLAGHASGAILSLAWSPTVEHVLASGGTDGGVRIWDVRRSSGCLGVMDSEDGVGVLGLDSSGRGARNRYAGRAHNGAVNGLVWVDGGRELISCGLDEKIRVWDITLGKNTFATFGPMVRNRNVAGVAPIVVPRGYMPKGEEVMFFPNEREILMFEVWEGRLVKRLKVLGLPGSGSRVKAGERVVKERVTALSWRQHDVELVSAHGDGMIRSWMPRTSEDALVDEAERAEFEDSVENRERKRKRLVLEDVEREVLGTKVSYL